MKDNIKKLNGAAMMKANPINIANMVLDATPEEGYQQLYDMVCEVGAIEKLCESFPEIIPYKAWYMELGDAIRAELTPEEVLETLTGTVESAINSETPQSPGSPNAENDSNITGN